MKKIIGFIALGCLAFIVAGGVLVGIGKACGGKLSWGFNYSTSGFAPRTETIVDGEYEIDEAITCISTNISSLNVKIMPGDEPKVVYHCYENDVPEIKVENGTLSVEEIGNAKINVSLNFTEQEEEYVNIYLPADKDYEIKIEMASGSINVKDLNVYGSLEMSSGEADIINSDCSGDLDIEIYSGSVMLENIETGSISSQMSSGDYSLSNVDSDSISIEITSGSVILDNVVTDDYNWKASSGSMHGSNIEAKNFKSNIQSGNVNVSGLTSDKIECTSTSGNTTIEVNGKESDYGCSLKASSGNIKCGNHEDDCEINMDLDKTITGNITSGNMTFSFSE